MKVVIQAAISADGFIATDDGNTDWVQDLAAYEAMCREYGCIVMGHTTYEEYGGPAFEGVEQIVLSNQTRKSKFKNVHFGRSVSEVVATALELGFEKLLVIGGGETNGSFLRAGLVDELLLDVHPLLLGSGRRLFGNELVEVNLRQLSVQQNAVFLSVHYSVRH